MAKVITTELQHAGASSANITLAADGSVTLPADTVDIATLSATGTASSSTFLRGDNSWQTISTSDTRLTVDAQRNIIIGTDAGGNFDGASASNNILFGYKAGEDITTSDGNALIGAWAGMSITTGINNIAIGEEALADETTGRDNVGIGRVSLRHQATSAGYNTFVGGQSGQDMTTGRDNTGIGFHAGKTITSGSFNVCLGRYAGSSEISTEDERLYIAWDDTPMSNANTWIYGNDSGACYQGNNSSSWSTTSDQRLKKNITDNTVGLSVIDNVKVRNFKYKQYTKPADTYYTESDTIPAGSLVGDIKVKGQYDTPATSEDTIDLSAFPSGTTAHQVVIGQGDTSTHVGVIAQELEAVCPDCIKTSDRGVKTVDTDELFWHMLNAIKELSTKVKALEAG
tara:strand:+ start:25 stop:1221 length:1197 start_codon:yes stop_codon:yes gene_type:complete